MKKVNLLQLELTNYRNIEHEVYVFNGKNAKIIGENRIGKTNTLEAIYFLLTNYLLDGSSDLTQLKPLDDTKKVVSVKGTFDVEGKTITLEKHYAEDWVKTRGTNDLVLKGHYEEYLVNDIPQSKSQEYYDLLEEYFGIRNDKKGEVDNIQLLCNPLYLGNLGDSKDWTNLRSFIIKLIGDVADEEIFEKEPTALLIKEDLEKALGKTEQVKKMYLNDINGLNTVITGKNANISLLEKTPKPADEDIAIARKGVKEKTAHINELQSSLSSNSVIASLEREQFEIKRQVLELNTKEYSAYQANQNKGGVDEVSELNRKLEEALDKATDIKFKLSSANSDKRIAEAHIASCNANRERFAKQYNEVKDRKNNVENIIEKVCPTCHRPLDEETIEEARKNYLSQLDEELAQITNDGKANSEELNKHKELLKVADDKVVELNAQLEKVNKEIENIKQDITKAKEEVANKDTGTSVFVESDDLKALRKQLETIDHKLEKARADESKRRAEVYEQIEDDKKQLANYQKVVDDFNYYERQMSALEVVKQEKTDACKKLADVEQKKECLELYNYTKLRLLDTHVANIFGNIKFQLIKENINGGFDPVCKPYIYDVEKNESTGTIWKSGSKSEKIATGIAIAEAIKKQLNLTNLPILFDEGGEISTDTLYNRLKTEAQIICVKVEDNILKPVVVNF